MPTKSHLPDNCQSMMALLPEKTGSANTLPMGDGRNAIAKNLGNRSKRAKRRKIRRFAKKKGRFRPLFHQIQSFFLVAEEAHGTKTYFLCQTAFVKE